MRVEVRVCRLKCGVEGVLHGEGVLVSVEVRVCRLKCGGEGVLVRVCW